MSWYGENLFRARPPGEVGELHVCASDAAGDETCAPMAGTPPKGDGA